jgi:GAF domain-containing protein
VEKPIERQDRPDTRSAALAAAAAPLLAEARMRFAVRRAALFWRDEPTGALTCVASVGEGGSEEWVGRTLPPGVGMAGRAVAEGRAVRSADLLADPRVPVTPWLRERLEHEGLRTVAAAPVRVGETVRGALGLLDAAGREFGDDDLRRLAAVADEVGHALGRAVPPSLR